MTRFAKLHETIVSSSIWNEQASTCKVWITMLALAREGRVMASRGGLAHAARVTPEECVAALEKFASPDPDSRTRDYEGRRIREIEGGWLILNFRKYSGGRDYEQRKEQTRRAVARHREANQESAPLVSPGQPEVSRGKPGFWLTSEDDGKKPKFSDGPASRRIPTTEQARRVAGIMHRKPSTPWQANEVAAYRQIGSIPEEDLAALERYYARHWPPQSQKNILRHDLLTLLNNFQGEVGRAHADAERARARTGPKPEGDPARWREFLQAHGQDYVGYRFAMELLRSRFATWGKSET